MKRGVLLTILSATLAFAAPASADDVFLLGFAGFDYEDPNPSPTYLDVGDGYKMLGFVTSFQGGPMEPYVDQDENEYTIYTFNLTVTSRFFDGPSQFLEVFFANDGRGRYFEDGRPGCSFCTPGTPANYGTNPPNVPAPSTFVDGTLALGGDIDNFYLNYYYNLSQGAASGQMNQDEGTHLTYIPPGQRNGWTLRGEFGPPNPTIPQGYVNQVSGECRLPVVVSTSHQTWGSLKALYR